MQFHAPAGQVRSAISSALAGRPRVVMVEAPNEAWYVQTVFAGPRRDAPVYVCDEEATSSTLASRPGSPPPAFGRYHRLVHPDYPLIAILVIRGMGSVQSTCLDENLFAYYLGNDTGEHAQQLMTGLALLEPDAVIDEGHLVPGTGVVVPLVTGRPPIVYRLNPGQGHDNVQGPPAFIRHRTFLVPRPDAQAVEAVRQLGFAPWRSVG